MGNITFDWFSMSYLSNANILIVNIFSTESQHNKSIIQLIWRHDIAGTRYLGTVTDKTQTT